MRMHRLILMAGLALLSGCSSSHPTSANPLVGRWSTGAVLNQLGPSMTRYTFRSDYTFGASFTAFFRASTGGKYRTDGDQIVVETQQRTNTARFHFDGDHLVIQERSDTYRLH